MVAEAHSPAPQSPLIPQRKTRAELEAEITALRAELAQSAAGRAPQRATPVVARQVSPESKTGGGDMMTIRGADDASGSRAQDSRPPVSGRDLLLQQELDGEFNITSALAWMENMRARLRAAPQEDQQADIALGDALVRFVVAAVQRKLGATSIKSSAAAELLSGAGGMPSVWRMLRNHLKTGGKANASGDATALARVADSLDRGSGVPETTAANLTAVVTLIVVVGRCMGGQPMAAKYEQMGKELQTILRGADDTVRATVLEFLEGLVDLWMCEPRFLITGGLYSFVVPSAVHAARKRLHGTCAEVQPAHQALVHGLVQALERLHHEHRAVLRRSAWWTTRTARSSW